MRLTSRIYWNWFWKDYFKRTKYAFTYSIIGFIVGIILVSIYGFSQIIPRVIFIYFLLSITEKFFFIPLVMKRPKVAKEVYAGEVNDKIVHEESMGIHEIGNQSWIEGRELFKVSGDYYKDQDILHGDFIYTDKQDAYVPGQLVVVQILKDTYVLSRIINWNYHLTSIWCPTKDGLKKNEISSCQIVGKVVARQIVPK